MAPGYPDDFRSCPEGDGPIGRDAREEADREDVRKAGARAWAAVETLAGLLDDDVSQHTDDDAAVISLAEAIEGVVARTRALLGVKA